MKHLNISFGLLIIHFMYVNDTLSPPKCACDIFQMYDIMFPCLTLPISLQLYVTELKIL